MRIPSCAGWGRRLCGPFVRQRGFRAARRTSRPDNAQDVRMKTARRIAVAMVERTRPSAASSRTLEATSAATALALPAPAVHFGRCPLRAPAVCSGLVPQRMGRRHCCRHGGGRARQHRGLRTARRRARRARGGAANEVIVNDRKALRRGGAASALL